MLDLLYDAYSVAKHAITHPSSLLPRSTGEERGPPDCSSFANLLALRDWETAFECMQLDETRHLESMDSDYPDARLVATAKRHRLLTVVEAADSVVLFLTAVCAILMIGLVLLWAFAPAKQRSKKK